MGVILLFHARAIGQNYVFAQMNGVPLNTQGWNLQGSARVTNVTGTGNGELLLCSIAGPSGAAFYNQPINLSMCSRWKAEFDFRMYDGTGADGLAFCFLDVPPAGFVTGGGLGIPNSANGLKVCFDTWNNCIPYNPSTVHQDMPKIEIRWGKGYNDDSNPNNIIYGECLSGPTRDNSDGKISFIRSATYQHAKITYDSGNIRVYVNDTLYLSGYQQFNFTGYLGFTGSIGGYNDNHSIKNVIIYTEMPPSYAGLSQSFCPHDTIQLGGSANPAYSYSWYPAAGLSDSTSASPFLHLLNDSSNTQSHIYYVRTAYSNKPGCSSVDSVTVNVYPNPKVHFVTPEICLTDAVAQFYDSSYTTDNTTLPFTYFWNFGDPNAGSGNADTSLLQHPSHIYSAARNYAVSLRVTNSRGCTDSSVKIFTVNGAVPKAAFEVPQTSGLCSNQPVQIINQSSVDFGSITRVELFWGDSANVSYMDSFPYPGKTYFHRYPDPVTAASTTYTIRMIAYSGISCQSQAEQSITLQPAPHVRWDSLPSLCDNGSSVDLSMATELTGLNGSFFYYGQGVSSQGVFNPQEAGSGLDTIWVKYSAQNGCADSAYNLINVVAAPHVNAGPDLEVLQGDSVVIPATATGIDLKYNWSPPLYLNDDSLLNPTCLPSDNIFYTLTVNGTGGCTSTSTILIKVLKIPVIPNAFSPNGDGINDVWNIKYLNEYPDCEVSIFNRYGQPVFHSVGYYKPWDGTSNGKPLPVATYYYVIDTKKQRKLFSGYILLIR